MTRKLFFLACLLGTGFVILEIGARCLNVPTIRYDEPYVFGVTRHPRPYIMFKGLEDGVINVQKTYNHLGYLGRSPLPLKAAGSYRIFILGGSTVWEGNPTIPDLLQKEFIRNGYPQVEVFNYGVMSSNSSMELARLVFEVLDFRPDLVVM